MSCYWRKDGVPIWRDQGLFARDDAGSAYGPVDARRFSEALATRLGVDPGYVNAAFEDPLHYLQRERQLPINVDPIDNRLEDPGSANASGASSSADSTLLPDTCCRCSAA